LDLLQQLFIIPQRVKGALLETNAQLFRTLLRNKNQYESEKSFHMMRETKTFLSKRVAVIAYCARSWCTNMLRSHMSACTSSYHGFVLLSRLFKVLDSL